MSPESSVPAPSQALIPAAVISDDQVLINGWLSQKRSVHTRRAYARIVRRLFKFLGHDTPRLRDVTPQDLMRFHDALKAGTIDAPPRATVADAIRYGYDAATDILSAVVDAGAVQDAAADAPEPRKPKETTEALTIAAIHSLFSFVARKVGFMQLNPAAALTAPRIAADLAQRIIPAYAVDYIIEKTTGREHVMCLMLYTTGVRVAELCGMSWRDVRERADGRGQVTVTGKGHKVRTILLERRTWAALRHMRPADASGADPVFRSRKGGHLSTTQAYRLIRDAIKTVRDIPVEKGKEYIADAIPERGFSPHWFRHAHASHALDNKCPIHVLQSTLGHSSIAVTSRYLHVNPDSSSADYIYPDKSTAAA